jgi:hypothetical protein
VNKKINTFIRTPLAVGVAAVLAGIPTLHADILTLDIDDNIAGSAIADTVKGGVFSILNSSGIVLQNTSYPYFGDPTWGYGRPYPDPR